MKNLRTVAAVAEAVTGLGLQIVPSLVGRLLLGTELTGVAVPVSPVGSGRTALCGMLIYSVLITAFLAYVGIRGFWVGPLLWPAVVFHAVLTFLLART